LQLIELPYTSVGLCLTSTLEAANGHFLRFDYLTEIERYPFLTDRRVGTRTCLTVVIKRETLFLHEIDFR
jgi:hypothetical protein